MSKQGQQQAQSGPQSVRGHTEGDTSLLDGTGHQRPAGGTQGGVLPKALRLPMLPVIRLRNFMTAEEDRTIGRVTFMSKPAEWHAAGVGYIVVVAVALALALNADPLAMASTFLGAGVSAGRAWASFARSGHVRDALKEPAYTALGATLGLLPAAGFLFSEAVQNAVSALPVI